MGAVLHEMSTTDIEMTIITRDRSISATTDSMSNLSPPGMESESSFFDGPFFGLEDNAIPTHMRGEAWKHLILGSSSANELDDDDDIAASSFHHTQFSYSKFTQLIEENQSSSLTRDHHGYFAQKQIKGDIGRICFALNRNVKLHRQQLERNQQNHRLLSRISVQRSSSDKHQSSQSSASFKHKTSVMSLKSASSSVTELELDRISTCSSPTSISSTASTCGSTISYPSMNGSGRSQSTLILPSRLESRLDHILSAYLNFHYTESYSNLLAHMCVPFAVSIPDEYDAFCCFDKFMAMRDSFLSEADTHARLSRFMMLLRTLLSDLFSHFEEEDVRFHDWAVSWIEGLLCRELPLQCILHLWDRYFTLSSSHISTRSPVPPKPPQLERDESPTSEDLYHNFFRSQKQKGSQANANANHLPSHSSPATSAFSPSSHISVSSSPTSGSPFDLHLYVCLSILLSMRETLEDLEHAEILSSLKRLPSLDMDQIVSQALRLRDELKEL